VTHAWFIAAILVAGAVTAAGQSNQSVYTSLGEKQCRTVKSAEAGDDGYEGRCRGVGGYTLLLSEGDLRQNITVITRKGAKHSLVLCVAPPTPPPPSRASKKAQNEHRRL
jgi:hypothetical protein